MADTSSVNKNVPPRRRSWLRVIGWVVGVLVILLVVAYFVGTSSAFVKGVILPKVSAAMNASVTVRDASVSPFRQVVLRDLKVQTTGTEPLVSAPEVRLRYSLMDIIRGNMVVHEAALLTPTITLVENPDGTSNLDPILKSQEKKTTTTAGKTQPKSSGTTQIDVKKVLLSNGTLRRVKLYAGGKRDVAELSNLNIEATNLKNGQTGKLTLGSDIKVENNPPAPATNGVLLAKLNGNFNLGLTPQLKPGVVDGETRFEVARAEGAMAQAAGMALVLNCQVTPTEIKQVALQIQKAGTRLGQVIISGPFDMEKTEGRLTLRVQDIDKNLLNLAGAGSGLDFGPTTVNSTNLIVLADAGNSVAAQGVFNLASFQVTRTNQTTPPMDLSANYDVTVDNAKQNVLVRALNLSATQKGNQFLKGELTSPMAISLKEGATNAIGDSAFNVAVTHFDLANWKAFLADVAPAGDVNMRLQLLSKQAGKQLSFELDSGIANLTAGSGSNQIVGATVTLRVRGQAADMKQFNLPEYRLQVGRQNESVLTVSGSGVYDQAAQTADLRIDGDSALPRLLGMMPQPPGNLSAGSARFNARLQQKQAVQNVTGSYAITELTGVIGSNSFKNFALTGEMDVGMNAERVDIRKLTAKLAEAGAPGGTFDLAGNYILNTKAAKLDARLVDFNQAGLRTFLEPMLGEKKLRSVAVNGNASAQYDPAGASSIKGDFQVTNLVVIDPSGKVPAKPLEARFQMDASLNKDIAEIRQFAVGLTPTERATNRVQLVGRVDMTQSTNIQGNVKLSSDALDLTTYYDLFGGSTSASATTQPSSGTAAPAPAPAPAPGPEKEAEPMRLPFSNFVAEASIGRLFLREVAVSNFQAVAKLNGGRVLLEPFKLGLNGAPVSSTIDLDLGVPGYKYNITAAAMAIPLAPLVNSFQPERKGQVGGTLTADAKIAGIGTTGAGLQKNLSGNFDVGSTNLNLSVIHIRNPLLKSLINVVALIPELAKNPEGALTSLVGALVPQQGAARTGGLSSELEKSPIDQIVLKGSMGGGKVQLQQALVQSAAFQALASGTVQLETVLSNSPVQIPVTLALSRSVASRINMLPADAPTNMNYVKLPDFVTMRGTMGQPKTDINKLALAGTVFKGVSGLIPGGTGQTGNLIQGILGGGNKTSTNAPGTNKPAGGLGGLLQGVLGNTPATTNRVPSVSTNAPASTNQNPINNLLDGILGPRKR